MNASTKAVFLSYASEDADAARGIGQALRGAGIEVWLDQSELRGGDAWDAAIRKQIKACALFMPVISANTRARAEGYFRLEWKLAVDRSHLMAAERAFLLPVVIDGTDDADALVPDKFREVQWTRLPAGEVPATFVEQVSRLLSSDDHISPSAIRQQAGAAPLPDALRAGTRPAPAPAPGHRSASRRSRQALLVMAAGVAIAAGYLAVDRFVLTKRSAFVEEAQTTLAGTAAPAAISEKSVAVLPFANLSSEKGDEYFADGISEELLNVLAKIPGLRVSARTASFQFKGKDTSAREVGRQLGVGYVVEGSVRKAGNQVRITAQLVKVADGFQVWSETFTRELKDIFAVQDEIAGRVARALQLRIGEGENLAAGATRNPAAYEAYLRGREASDGEESGAREGVRLQQQAISLDPGFALAHAALADSYVELAKSAREQRDKAYPLARASAERALALDKRIALAHIALAEHAFNYAWDWDEADRQSRMALAIDPNHYHALGHFATHELVRGRFDSALDAVRKAEERNPLIGTTERQWILIGMKRYDEAIRLARKDLADRPGSKESLGYLGVALVLAGRHDEGLRVLEERAAAQPNSTHSQAVLGWAYGRAGQATKAHAVLQRLADVGKARRVSPFQLAWVYAGLDDRDRAFAELERAYEQRDGAMPLLAAYWTLESLHGDPRFRSLLKRMKLDTYFPETPAPR